MLFSAINLWNDRPFDAILWVISQLSPIHSNSATNMAFTIAWVALLISYLLSAVQMVAQLWLKQCEFVPGCTEEIVKVCIIICKKNFVWRIDVGKLLWGTWKIRACKQWWSRSYHPMNFRIRIISRLKYLRI